MRSLLSRLDRHLAPSPDPARVGWLRDWSYAHRGLHSDGVPENSLAAFAGAMERGMGIECDIQRSQDHAAILMHDWELDRLTGVSGPTAGYSAEELAQLDRSAGQPQDALFWPGQVVVAKSSSAKLKNALPYEILALGAQKARS